MKLIRLLVVFILIFAGLLGFVASARASTGIAKITVHDETDNYDIADGTGTVTAGVVKTHNYSIYLHESDGTPTNYMHLRFGYDTTADWDSLTYGVVGDDSNTSCTLTNGGSPKTIQDLVCTSSWRSIYEISAIGQADCCVIFYHIPKDSNCCWGSVESSGGTNANLQVYNFQPDLSVKTCTGTNVSAPYTLSRNTCYDVVTADRYEMSLGSGAPGWDEEDLRIDHFAANFQTGYTWGDSHTGTVTCSTTGDIRSCVGANSGPATGRQVYRVTFHGTTKNQAGTSGSICGKVYAREAFPYITQDLCNNYSIP